jgi:signal transduction histidine kinase
VRNLKIFKKTFITVFSCFLIVIIFLSYILASTHIQDSENGLIEQNRLYGKLISKQIEIGYLQSDWPYELLNDLSNRDDFIFWWVVKDDGTIYRSDNISFMKTNAYEYFPQLEEKNELDDTIYSNYESNYAIYFKSFNYGSEEWTIWIGFSLDIVYVTSMNIITTVSLVVIPTLIAIFFILFFLVKSFTNPIITLWKSVSEFGSGNYNAVSDIHSKDEIGLLSKEFNIMTKNIKDSKAKIENYSNNLEKLLKQKDEFITQLGHDLKTPLGPLISLLPIIKKKTTDPKTKEMVNVSIHASNRINNLVKKTIKLAQLNSTKQILKPEEIYLSKLVEESIKRNDLLLNNSNLIVKNEIAPNLLIKVDPVLISELFDNLITNAIKYCQHGGIITIETSKKGNNLVISVNDEGIGLDKEQIKYIFDEFYKTDPSRHDLDSSGLGLAISKRIVELHGGTIGVKSQGLGKGCTFYFSLPFNSSIHNGENSYISHEDFRSNLDKLFEENR